MCGGHTAVSVNVVVDPDFPNVHGLRQGDLISPILFDFVVDAFSCILNRADAASHILMVISDLTPSGISHLQYADDTIILVENNDLCISNLKFLLLCFEALSGLKINFSKTEVILSGSPAKEASRVFNLLNCNLGYIPFTYLGLPISPAKLCACDFAPSVLKVGN